MNYGKYFKDVKSFYREDLCNIVTAIFDKIFELYEEKRDRINVFISFQEGYFVSVISCAAPMVSPSTHRREDTTDEQMEVLLYRRIVGVLTTLICHISTEGYL